jgi:hypothetical protein
MGFLVGAGRNLPGHDKRMHLLGFPRARGKKEAITCVDIAFFIGSSCAREERSPENAGFPLPRRCSGPSEIESVPDSPAGKSSACLRVFVARTWKEFAGQTRREGC